MSEADIQKLLDSSEENGTVRFPEGEYEGKFIVRKSCVIDGCGSVLWSSSGPILVIDAENVTVRDLKIELTNDNIPYEQRISVYCRYPDTKFSDVEVNAMLLGIPGEEQYWGLPRVISLGRLPAEREQSFALELYVPKDTEISCGFHDIRLSADVLTKGFNTVTLTVGKIKEGSKLYGYITLMSAAARKIVVSGEIGGENEPSPLGYMLCSVEREAPIRHSKMLETLDPVQLSTMPDPKPEEVAIPFVEAIDEYDGGGDEYYEENVIVPSGKRIPLSTKQYKIELTYRSTRTGSVAPDIDGYMFMLSSGGTVSLNNRMIFFGNDHSECGSVRYLNAPDKRAMFVDLRTIPNDVTHMVMLFSIYGNDPAELFSNLKGAEISVLCENGVHLHIPLEDGINCRTILALGFEKSDGVWEMISSGKGVGMPLAEICRSYGVTVR